MLIALWLVGTAIAQDDRLMLRDAPHGETTIRVGTFRVFEDREAGAGREIHLDVVILPARSDEPAPDPVFVLMGGPGQNAAALASHWLDHWFREERDIVLLGQRGTGGDNDLRCVARGPLPAQEELDAAFEPEAFRACLDDLSAQFDLTKYATHLAIDDAEDLRQALGYGQINLSGGSYGTRAALVYLRRHPESVRCAIMNGVAPIEFINPLYHAQAAQQAIDLIFAECDASEACRERFGDLEGKFLMVLARLDAGPVPAHVVDPATGARVEVELSRRAFADGLRVIMYSDSRRVPLMIDRAFEGDFDLIAQAALASKRAIRDSLAMGMLLCVTCAEDVAQITPEMIAPATDGSFFGADRVRGQMAICAFWPRSDLPGDFDVPVASDVPVLLLSGTLDPVTPPVWGEVAGRHLSRSLHVVAPGAHGVGGGCIESIVRAFLADPDPAAIDTSCVERMELGPFDLGR